ncbi:alpha/beta hydrolase [Marinoscillum furvescens]|uniref:Alpha/beta hydrolase family protein n=1 Tax=Marinoscillum furvescens DSM 4134 TaxID=1122208 RepID=A0A3D9L3E4_MARFU|nr:alpha/beta hydrolase [Marinoscillum furvescens]RED99814.1 alpha/beta hydrolase family protein [Marinoscillum furvescens DSM 4134]
MRPPHSITVYGIGGLGVNHEVFAHLDLDFELIVIEWITPHNGESLASYAQRLSAKINTDHPFAIIGISFGGILAAELAKILKPLVVVLISSAQRSQEIPLLFRLIGRSGVFNLLPDWLLRPPLFAANWLFGVKTNHSKKLLKLFLKETDLKFLRWALTQIARWKGVAGSASVIRIHGSADRLLSCENDTAFRIKNGRHFMVVDDAAAVSEVLRGIYATYLKPQ